MTEQRTERGFRVFASEDGVKVWESRLALFEGPHVRVEGGGHLHLSLAKAKIVLAGLRAFIREAEAGKLTEKP